MSGPGTERSTAVKPEVAEPRRKPRRQRPYHVVLLNDEEHTYEYVIEMLGRLFGHPAERGCLLACEVDTVGRAIVDTTTLERAELKRDQIRAYGADWRVKESRGSMAATIEQAA
ncbi:MAG: ATP-dependent Clp protease adaptor ClpS [Phycisphaerae bacterium]|nr:ATP-dependent Clp protease adaptor ClpS [Phycisphaerae bacterium]